MVAVACDWPMKGLDMLPNEGKMGTANAWLLLWAACVLRASTSLPLSGLSAVPGGSLVEIPDESLQQQTSCMSNVREHLVALYPWPASPPDLSSLYADAHKDQSHRSSPV